MRSHRKLASGGRISMKSNGSCALRALTPLLTLWVLSVTIPAVQAQQFATQDSNDLTGSWLITLDRVLPSQNRGLALATFNAEGTFIGTAQGDSTILPG